MLEEEGEDGMLHSLLSCLPYLSDESSANISKDTPDAEVFVLKNLTSNGHDEVPRENDVLVTETTNGSINQDKDANDSFSEKSILIEHSGNEEHGGLDTEKLEMSLNNGEDVGDMMKVAGRSSPTNPVNSPPRPDRKAVYLHRILEQADELYTLYPPTHPDLHVSSILGPRSVVFTWSENRDEALSDEEAEEVVSHPELVVLAYRDPEEMAKQKGHPRGKSSPSHNHPRGFSLHLDSRTMLATGIAVAGIAVAVYSLKTRGGRGKLEEAKRAGQWLADIFNNKVLPF